MIGNNRAQLDALMAQIEEMWGHLNNVFQRLKETDRWDQKHGADWTFADVPYHLAYYNNDIVARGLELGPNVAEEEQDLLSTLEDINSWNACKLIERPFYQTPAQTVSRWQASCEAIYCQTLAMNDDDLEQRPFWMPLLSGWITAREGLELCRIHDWIAFTQLSTHLRRPQPSPNGAITHNQLETGGLLETGPS
jgi:hypothetical protein